MGVRGGLQLRILASVEHGIFVFIRTFSVGVGI